MKQITKIFDGRPQRLDNVATGTDRRIRTVAVLNNTPYYLYVGREQNVGRESALIVVEPYSDVIQPVSEAQALYVVEGSPVGTVPVNCQATLMWGAEVFAHGQRRTSRNVVIPVYTGKLTGGMVTTNMTAQGIGSDTPKVFAVPASARRRTLYQTGAGSMALDGSADGVTWFELLNTAAAVSPIPDTLAFPPYLRLKLAGTDGNNVSAFMVVDL